MSVGRREVLVLCEVASTAEEVRSSLSGSGFEVIPADTGDDFLSRITKASPDVILLPVSQSTPNPEEFLLKIRERAPDLPVVLLADPDSVDSVVPLLEAGADDFLIWPGSPEKLLFHILSRNVSQRQERKKRRRSERELKKLNRTLVESLKLLEQDQQAGFRVQQGMMPETPFLTDGLKLEHLIVPSLILSGDFIDYFELPDGRLLFYIADVSGHGAPGAIVTVLLKSLSSRLYNEFDELGLVDAGEILGWFNRELLACNLEQHATMFMGLVDASGERLQYANAAQFPASILSGDGDTRYLEMGGLPLGIYPTGNWQCREVALPKTFTMVMFSDGVFEILPEATLKAKEQHLLSLVQSGNGDLDLIADHLGLGEVKDIVDDIAVFTVARAG